MMSNATCLPGALKHDAPIVLGVGVTNAGVPISAAIAAACLLAGATTSGFAAPLSPGVLALPGSRVVAAARHEEIQPSIVDALGEIKRKAGLTWDHLAKFFDVSRRTIHS